MYKGSTVPTQSLSTSLVKRSQYYRLTIKHHNTKSKLRSKKMSASQTYLVVGASRGIGKGLVEHLAANPSNKVIATVRKATSDFDSFPNVSTISLDQASLSSVDSAASKLTEPVDTLIVNAAIGGDEKALTTSEERWQEYFNVNVLGFLRVVKAFLPALRKGSTKKIVLISSGAGSLKIEVGFEFGFAGPYAVSKVSNLPLSL